MANSMKYKIIPEKKLIIEVYSGVLKDEDYFVYKLELSKDPIYNPSYNIIVDFTKTVFEVNVNHIKEFILRLKENPHMYAARKSAYITDTPNQVTVTSLYTALNKENTIDSNTFTTLKSAMKWVEVKESDFAYIEEEFKKLC